MSDQQPSHFALDRLPIKLEGASNYTTWCTYVKAALKGQNLYGHITGTTVKPAAGADVKPLEEWNRRDEKAQSIIMLGVMPTMVNHIAGDMTAKEMWDRLAVQCRRRDMATRLSLMQQLFTTRLRSGENVDQHISAMNDIRTQFINIGKPIEDDVAAFALLLSVPAEVPQWEMFLRSHTTSDKEPGWDDVSAAMRAEASLQHQRDRTLIQSSSDAAVVAYAASAKGKQSGHQRSGRPYCTHCNKAGHVMDTCWTLHPDLRKQRQQSNSEYALAVTVSNSCCSANSATATPGVGLWHVDSGASSHLTGNRTWFTELHQCQPVTVTVADHGTLTCAQRGTVVLNTQRGRITVRNVLFVPSLGVNLLSVSAIVNAGMRVRFTKGGCSIRTSRNKLIVQATAHNNIYSVQAAPHASEAAYSVTSGSSEPLNWTTAHARMGHLNPKAMQAMLDKQMAIGLTAPAAGSAADIDHCAGCLAGKSHRQPFPAQASHRATRPLQLVHSDICGPIQADSGNKDSGKRYIITFIDDYSRFMWVAITSDKTGSTALKQFVRYKMWAERYTGFEVKSLRTDGGGEYINDQFTTYLHTMGIERQVTVARTPQQNGVAERANRTIMEAARSMLHAAGLPLEFWEYAVLTAVYLRNRSPTRALTDATPYEAWRGDKPDLSHLRAFGCRAYMHLDSTRRSKLQPRSVPVIFVGYAPEAKGWLVYDPVSSNKKTHTSRDVTFHESVAGGTLLNTAVSAAEPAVINSPTTSSSATRAAEPIDILDRLSSIDILIETDTESDNDDNEPEAAAPSGNQSVSQPAVSLPEVASEPPVSHQRVPGESPVSGGTQVSSSPRRKGQRVKGQEAALRQLQPFLPRGRVGLPDEQAHYALAVQVGESIGEPRTYKEAIHSPYRVQWERAMQEELDSIKANKTFTLVPLPAGRQAIGSKWVYKVKRHVDGSIDRFKARLVAKGYAQLYGIDFTETFAPVVRFSSLRAILAIAAAADYEVHQMDVKTAFLNGDLDEDIYMQQPDGYRAADDQASHVWKLNKSLYGLKQAGRAWNKKMDQALIELGFKPLQTDSCVYVKRSGSSVMYLLVYVDDLLLVTNDTAQLAATKAALSSRFDMKDMGEAHFILGVQIRRDRAKRQLYLSQAEYIRTVLKRFRMEDCQSAASPMATGVKLLKTDPADATSTADMASVPYASAVGALMYAALATRPDIAYAVTALCQFMANPAVSHWLAVKRVFRYLQGRKEYELTYGWTDGKTDGKHQPLYGYSDSDWGNDVNDRRSITGWVFLLHNGAVSWQSRKQPTVALSSVEAEYMAATQATREAVWWRAFLAEIGIPPTTSTTIYSDSQGAIALGKNPEHHKRTKHIDIQHHYVREQVAAGSVNLIYISTEDMVADVLTKPLAAERHNGLAGKMGMKKTTIASNSSGSVEAAS
jgi:hypothetical protein